MREFRLTRLLASKTPAMTPKKMGFLDTPKARTQLQFPACSYHSQYVIMLFMFWVFFCCS